MFMAACPALYLLSGEQQSKLCRMAAEFVAQLGMDNGFLSWCVKLH